MKFLKTRAFPSFYQDYAPKLIEFFGLWIDWLNENGNAAYIIDHLSSERDIDDSIEAYKTHIKDKLLVDYPESISSDLKLLLKNIFYLYNSKSSIKSYDFLFRCLFNSPAVITYPKNNILKASDGRWNIPKYLSIYGRDVAQFSTDYSSYLIIGAISNARAYINGHTVFYFDKNTVRNSILLASVDGVFLPDENLIIKNPENDEIVDIDDVFVEFYGEGEGGWEGQNGFLNSSMVLQDSYYYQDFSYIIRSNVSINKWRNIVKNVIHPAGLQFFGDLLLSEDEDNNGVGDIHVNPTDFLRNWHLLFKMYLFEVSAKINFNLWKTKTNSLAQRHSETIDSWLYYGCYHAKDGYNKIVVDTANNYFNRSSVLLFRENGTLIHPKIIDWGLFEFTENIEGSKIHGVTLDPQSHILYGEINGNSWKPEVEESFISKNFMMFVTNTSPSQNNKVKGFVVANEYLRYDEPTEDEGLKDVEVPFDFLVNDTKLDYEAKKFPNEIKSWKNLTVRDYIATSKETDRLYDNKSLLKVPDNFISTNENKYVIDNHSYDNERIVIYSYAPTDFTHRIFINRENNKVDVYYTNYNWYNSITPKNPILDSNLHILDTSVSVSTDANTDIYKCESFSYDDDGNEYNLQQTQFTIELPYNVAKENILLFTDGKYSKNFKLKNNIILIDTEDNEREIICYIQDDGRITVDKEGKRLLYILDKKTIIYNEEEILFVHDSGYISTDYLGIDVKYKITANKNITTLNGTVIYRWNENNIITDLNGNEIYKTKSNQQLIVDRDIVKYFIQENKTITTDIQGESVIYYLQPDNTITTNYILYESSMFTFGDCTYKTTLSKSETNTAMIEEFMLLDEIVIELNNATTKEFGDLTLEEVVYSIYGIEQTRMKSTAELYILSPTNAMRQETTPYMQDRLFTYNSAVLSPFGLYNTQINHFHIVNYKDLYDMEIESNDWLRRWLKEFVSETVMKKQHHIHLTLPSQNHSETMDDVFARNLIEMYNIRWLNRDDTLQRERASALNLYSTLVFDDSGVLVDTNKIDWFNMRIDGSNVLYSLQLSPETIYNVEDKILAGNEDTNMNYFMFINGEKVLDGYRKPYIEKCKTGEISKDEVKLYNYNSNFIAKYQTGSGNVIYIDSPIGNESTDTNKDVTKKLHEIDDSTVIILKDGSIELLKNLLFSQIIEDKALYVMTGNDIIPIKTKVYNINPDYILVFVDGRYTKNWEYRSNGSILLKDTPKKTYEVYILQPYDYNTQDMTVKGVGNTFSFNNLRLNPYIKAAEVKLIDEKMLVSSSDILFVNNQLKKLAVFKQSMFFWKQFLRDNKDAIPNIMLHYTMDRLLSDGSFDIHSYAMSEIPQDVKVPTRFICDLETKDIVYYIQYNDVITDDYEGNNVVYYLKDDGIYSDNEGINLVYKIKDYDVLDTEGNDIVYRLILTGRHIVDTPTRFICDLDTKIVYYIQPNNTITEDIYGENIVYYLIDDAIYYDVDGNEKVYNIEDDKVLSIEDNTQVYSIKLDGRLINELESKFNRHSTMLFDKEGLLVNPNSVNWGHTLFIVPQLTNGITAVCLNGYQPALVGNLIKTNQRNLLTSQASILDDVSISKTTMNVIETLDITDNIVRDPYTYETDMFETVGLTDYIYQKNSEEAYDTLYTNKDDFIPENIFVFVNGKKVYKDDLEIRIDNNSYIIHNEEKYNNSRITTAVLGSLTENDIIMLMEHNLSAVGNTNSESDVLFVENEISIDDMEDFNQKTIVIRKITNSKECVVFQYNPEDIDAFIEEKHPSSRFFNLPDVGYTKDNILAFKNGIRTTDYYILGDKICFNDDGGIIDTIEIYVFKKYDYLFIDENKYNKNCYDFIIKNIKRSIFF